MPRRGSDSGSGAIPRPGAAVVVLVAALAPGCDPTATPGDPCSAGDAPELEVGKGGLSFSPMDDGGTIELVHGPQGGYHVEVALRAKWIDASHTLLGRFEGEIDGQVLATADAWLDFRCNGEAGALDSFGTLLIWDAVPEDLDGRTATIRVEVTDASDRVVAASAETIIEDPLL